MCLAQYTLCMRNWYTKCTFDYTILYSYVYIYVCTLCITVLDFTLNLYSISCMESDRPDHEVATYVYPYCSNNYIM